MELKEIIKNFKKYGKLLIISLFAGLFLGYLGYLLPKPYYATGSFYVKRAVDTTRFNYFAYEGYYAQQTGISYTNTTQALMESLDVKHDALAALNLPANTENLRKLSSFVRIKKSGPQLITLTVKGRTGQEALSLWESIADTTIEKNKQVNISGDPLLSITKVSLDPVVTEQYKPFWLCLLLGMITIPLLVILSLSFRDYFKWR